MTGPSCRAAALVREHHEKSSLDPAQPASAPQRFHRGSEPIPFRRYEGAPTVPFPIPSDSAEDGSTAALDVSGLGRLFWNALALVGWKRVANAAFGMRVVPSAGNLHPTECHLLAADLETDGPSAALYHYSPFDHALERRRVIPITLWRQLGAVTRAGGVLVGLTTIPWRCAWKYGERAFRLCHLDAGHAAAALRASAALFGWRVDYIEVSDLALEGLLGVGGDEPEDEQVVCLLAVMPKPDRVAISDLRLDDSSIRAIADLPVDEHLRPTAVSQRHRRWPGLVEMARATRRDAAADMEPPAEHEAAEPWPVSVLRRRRSCNVFADGEIDAESAGSVLAAVRSPIGRVFPWRGEIVSLVLVHRVEGWAPGLYLLTTDETPLEPLRATMRQELAWSAGPELDAGQHLVLLAPGDARRAATFVAGEQDAAGSSALTVVMVARFSSVLTTAGAWAYRRLHWQAGEIGHRLYLAAEAAGLGATGLSGFYDRHASTLVGLRDDDLQALYLFAVGLRGDDDPVLEAAYSRRGEVEPSPPSRGGWVPSKSARKVSR
ncbi:MAG: nitroreductase family protein [Thermoanaerobaculia bacterium]|nr:nitroreductase family protein [Thermoanaerobaculia bacterium]